MSRTPGPAAPLAHPQNLLCDGETGVRGATALAALVWPGVISLLLVFGLAFRLSRVNGWFSGSWRGPMLANVLPVTPSDLPAGTAGA